MTTTFDIKLVSQPPGHEERAWHASWNPTLPLLASCSADKTVRIYLYTLNEDGEPRFSLESVIPTGHKRTVRSIAWSPSGTTLATASFDSTVGIWERVDSEGGSTTMANSSGDWECISTLEGHETECKSVAYSSTGTLLASCSRDKSVWVWEVQPEGEFECLSVLMEHSQDVKVVAWHPKEEILASASYDNSVKLYLDDPSDDWYPFATLSGHSSTVWSVSFSPCGNYLASSSDDSTIRIWKRATAVGNGQAERPWNPAGLIEAHEGPIYHISWGMPSKLDHLGLLASVGGDGALRVWRIQFSDEGQFSSTEVASMQDAHNEAEVNSVEWCVREGLEDCVATAADDGSVKVWKVCKKV